MKNSTLVLLLFCFVFTACDERFGFLGNLNRSPVVFFRNNTSLVELSDSLKTSVKNGKQTYDITVSFSDPENQLSTVNVSVVGGTGVLRQDGNVITNSIGISSGTAQISFKPDAGGNFTLLFTATDSFDKTATASLALFVFDNLPPIAKFTESKLAINSPYEYQFDASQSFDQDKSKGGAIQAYRFLINNTVEILTQQRIVKYVFPGTGGQEVKLEVYDNNGAKSTVFTKVIQVN
ncbi:MAG: hypothetical protein IM613_17480 [Cytophagales bacterium]|nr:hypothetical protein [Cytophagales bacterium]